MGEKKVFLEGFGAHLVLERTTFVLSNMDEMRNRQHQFWNLASQGWRKWDKVLMDWLRPVGEKILESVLIEDDYVVLDFATGSGEPGLSAAKRVGKGSVIGADFSEEMLRIAYEKAKSLGVKNYETRLLDSPTLPFSSGYFDAVTCRFGVMFFPDILTGLREMTRVLKPNRRLAVSVWGPQDKRALAVAQIIAKSLQLPVPAPDSPGPYRCSERGMITCLLSKSGLDDVEEFELTGQVTWDSPEQYWEYMTVSPLLTTALRNANEESREKTRREVLAALSPVKGSDGKISFNWVAWVDSGIKLDG